MESDPQKFLRTLFQLWREFHEQLGALAWILLGVALVIGILLCLGAVGWIRRGGLAPGFSRRFFLEQRERKRWQKAP